VGGWLVAVPVPFMLMWAGSWNAILAANVLLGAGIQGKPHAMDAFIRLNAGTISPPEFFEPENLRALMATA
jgi:hypothetical protein